MAAFRTGGLELLALYRLECQAILLLVCDARQYTIRSVCVYNQAEVLFSYPRSVLVDGSTGMERAQTANIVRCIDWFGLSARR